MVAETDGFKMLRPQAEMRVCGGSFVAGAARRGEDLLGEAIQRMLRLDPEADSIAHVQVEWTWRSIGLYDWRCVAVRGDLVREIRTILLPMPGAHEGH